LKLQNRLYKSVRSDAACCLLYIFIFLFNHLRKFSAAGGRVNGISMRDYVYAAWAKQIAVPLQAKLAAFGGRSLHYAECLRALLIYQVMARLWSCHSPFSFPSPSPSHRIPCPSSAPALFMEVTPPLSAKSSHIIHPSHPQPPNCPLPAGSCSRLLPHHCTLVQAI